VSLIPIMASHVLPTVSDLSPSCQPMPLVIALYWAGLRRNAVLVTNRNRAPLAT